MQELKHGYWIEPSSDTTLSFVEYKYGKRHGKFIEVDQKCNLIAEGRMKKGLKHGSWIYYHPGAGTIARVVYKQGIQVSRVIKNPRF